MTATSSNPARECQPGTASLWQPIASAPQDGTHILGGWRETWPKNPHAEAVYFDEGSWWYSYDGDGPARPPTHWQPLPEPQK